MKPPTSKTAPIIAQQITTFQQMRVPELVREYERLHGRPPHVKSNRTWLWKRCAFRVQELALGGLPEDARTRLEQLMPEVVIPAAPDTVTGSLPRRCAKGDLAPGTTLVRTWRGQQITVRVTDTGFDWNGVPYRSLSAVAHAVTGAHWSGNLFFNLKKRSTGA